jgi:hypothetical protein
MLSSKDRAAAIVFARLDGHCFSGSGRISGLADFFPNKAHDEAVVVLFGTGLPGSWEHAATRLSKG